MTESSPEAQHAEIRPSPVPIWAPNPAVPLPARILAYLFGGITLLTALLGLIVQRPPDVPSVPKQWMVYRTSQGCSFPYPPGWIVKSQQEKGSEDILFALMPRSPVRIESYVMQLEMPVTAPIIEQLQQMLDPKLRKRFTHYTPWDDSRISTSADKEQAFTFDLADGSETKMAGALLIRSSGSRILFFVAVTPQDGWAAMRQIIDHMLASASFE